MPFRAAPDAPSLVDLAADLRAGRRDPVEVLDATLERIDAVDPEVRAFVHLDRTAARAAAEDRWRAQRDGEPTGPLHGIPIGVKDLFDVAGQESRAGSAVPVERPASADAVAVARARGAGAVIVGRTRTHEFAWGLTTQHAELGGTANPWDTSRVPGGSSGGSAAAVAAGMVPMALGTDTGCSIRLPAAWCGLVGHKPTFGLVPLDGVVPLAPSLDHGGALVRTVPDARLALEVLAGVALPPPAGVGDLRVGVGIGSELPPPAAAIEAAVLGALDGLADRVAEVASVEVPMAGLLPDIYRVEQGREALDWHRRSGRWPRWRERYGSEVRARLERCEQLTAAEIEQAARRRRKLRTHLDDLFARIDLLVLPVASAGPSSVAEPDLVDVDGQHGDLRAAVLPWTVLANLGGLPACSVPIGVDADGLPIGLQIVGPPGADGRVLDLAAELAVSL